MSKLQSLQVKISKCKGGMLAQCLDKPEIIVTGKNKNKIEKELHEIIEGYVEAFPDTKNEFYKKDGSLLEVRWVETKLA